MNDHARKTRTILLVVVVVAIVVIAIYYFTANKAPVMQTVAPALTPEEARDVLNSLQSGKSGTTTMTEAQKKSLQTLGGTGSAPPVQTSNDPAKQKSLLDSLQSN